MVLSVSSWCILAMFIAIASSAATSKDDDQLGDRNQGE